MTSSNIRGRYSVGRWFTSISSLQYQLQLHVMSLIKDHIQHVRLSQNYLASSAKGSCQGFVIFYLSILRLVLLQKAIVSTVLFSGILFSGLSCKARKHSTHFLCPREVTQTSFSDITDHFNNMISLEEWFWSPWSREQVSSLPKYVLRSITFETFLTALHHLESSLS